MEWKDNPLPLSQLNFLSLDLEVFIVGLSMNLNMSGFFLFTRGQVFVFALSLFTDFTLCCMLQDIWVIF